MGGKGWIVLKIGLDELWVRNLNFQFLLFMGRGVFDLRGFRISV
jgi:hypothetical protein